MRTTPGVGPLVAACYVLTLHSPDVLGNNRQAELSSVFARGRASRVLPTLSERISKTGNTYLRSLLVQSAQYILGRFGPDSALRRWGLKLAASGGKRGKKRAIVAVARKLAVLLHSIWRSQIPFQAFPPAGHRSGLNVLRTSRQTVPKSNPGMETKRCDPRINLEFG